MTGALPPALPRRGRRLDIVLAAVLAAILAAAWLPRTEGPLDLRWDAGVYYVLGTALAQGKGYRLLNEPGEIRAIQYPPLLPALVAAHQLVLGTDDHAVVGRWLRLTFFLISIGLVVASYALLRAALPARLAFAGALLCLLNPSVLTLSNGLMAEIPFALVSTLFVLAATRKPAPATALAGFLAILAYLLRTAGIALLVAWVADGIDRRSLRTTLLRLGIAIVPVVAWHAYVLAVETSPSYASPAYPYQRAAYLYHNVSYATNLSLQDPFLPERGRITTGSAARRFLSSIPGLPATLGEGVSAPKRSWEEVRRLSERLPGLAARIPGRAIDVVLICLGALVLVGLGIQLWRGERLVPIYLGGYMLLIGITPWPVNWARYWAPLSPLFVLAALEAVRALHDLRDRARLPGRARKRPYALGVGVAAILLIDLLSLAVLHRSHFQRVEYQDRHGRRVAYRLFFYRDQFRAFDIGLDWLMQRARPSDIVATSMPHWVHVRTGLRGIMPPADPDPGEALRLLDSVPVAYVMAGGSTAVVWAREHAFPAVRAAPDRWSPVHVDPAGALTIYRRVP